MWGQRVYRAQGLGESKVRVFKVKAYSEVHGKLFAVSKGPKCDVAVAAVLTYYVILGCVVEDYFSRHGTTIPSGTCTEQQYPFLLIS